MFHKGCNCFVHTITIKRYSVTAVKAEESHHTATQTIEYDGRGYLRCRWCLASVPASQCIIARASAIISALHIRSVEAVHPEEKLPDCHSTMRPLSVPVLTLESAAKAEVVVGRWCLKSATKTEPNLAKGHNEFTGVLSCSLRPSSAPSGLIEPLAKNRGNKSWPFQ
ncbi:uncharacterized protein CIMG_13748 [Coccidioides immitis RS]|uniref:Uncharacterized protein n=1 Tax=Coccidioides immitis (strain RS) TaxID=246410 RepID=A0A0D8JWR3_COCIM|nr:uncharacterized protein CIMG_13748 [Coccidioides immitis RS]KJF61574.1 hypothetical protein CIMG_13748 [Coccidioides immitis RS]